MSQESEQLQRWANRGRKAEIDAAIAAAPRPGGKTHFRVKIVYPSGPDAYACAILLPDGHLPRVGERTGGRGRITQVYQVPDNAALPVTAYTPPPKTVL